MPQAKLGLPQCGRKNRPRLPRLWLRSTVAVAVAVAVGSMLELKSCVRLGLLEAVAVAGVVAVCVA